MHNGFIDGFAAIKRDLVLAVNESLFPEIKGQADTEVLFYLALTFGLADDPPEAVARAIGLVEACGWLQDHPLKGETSGPAAPDAGGDTNSRLRGAGRCAHGRAVTRGGRRHGS
jgi:hypothetical protein